MVRSNLAELNRRLSALPDGLILSRSGAGI